MLKRNVQNLNKEYLLICIVKAGVHVSTFHTPAAVQALSGPMLSLQAV